ncbi:MAG: hypothetical protein WC695_06165 [Candidatus Omnitrophota bacterium]
MFTKMTRIVTALFLLLSVCIAVPASAQEKTGSKETVRKEVTGVISGLSSNFMAVTYGADDPSKGAYEMAFTIDKKIKVEHKNKLSDIKFGDTVTVKYDEITEILDNGRKKRTFVAQAVMFLKAAPRDLTSQEEAIMPAAGAATNDSLPLKGVKER